MLGRLNEIVTQWIQKTLKEKGYGEEVVAQQTEGAKIYTFGSYRLGVHGQDADIDTLCVGPRPIDIADFFGGLQPMLEACEECRELVAVTEAYVPVMKMKFMGVDIDLLYARLSTNTVVSD